ncbi:MAG: DUF998 domain-containing protein [Actinomycetota bacterium]|nr:DUF998 domain-containing protein [Actinomycetota bacterium]
MRDILLSGGGIVGPAVFVTAWAVLGARADGYDPTRDAISRLAAIGAGSRPLMTAALVTLGAGMVLYSGALRTHLDDGSAWVAALANGAFTLAVAAVPLGSGHDVVHGVAAGLGYATLAAIPVLATHGPDRLRPTTAWAAVSTAAGVVSAVCLALTLAGARSGLFQRLGLTAGQAWVVASAVSLARRPTTSSTTGPDRGSAGPPR